MKEIKIFENFILCVSQLFRIFDRNKTGNNLFFFTIIAVFAIDRFNFVFHRENFNNLSVCHNLSPILTHCFIENEVIISILLFILLFIIFIFVCLFFKNNSLCFAVSGKKKICHISFQFCI